MTYKLSYDITWLEAYLIVSIKTLKIKKPGIFSCKHGLQLHGLEVGCDQLSTVQCWSRRHCSWRKAVENICQVQMCQNHIRGWWKHRAHLRWSSASPYRQTLCNITQHSLWNLPCDNLDLIFTIERALYVLNQINWWIIYNIYGWNVFKNEITYTILGLRNPPYASSRACGRSQWNKVTNGCIPGISQNKI